MKKDKITQKLFVIGVIGAVCFVASMLVLGLVHERAERFEQAKSEIAGTWGSRQSVVGPMLVVDEIGALGVGRRYIIFPDTLTYEATLKPEERTRGIFATPVYTSDIHVAGTFSGTDLSAILAEPARRGVLFVLAIADTRGIERQIELAWGNSTIPLEPSSELSIHGGFGLHADISAATLRGDIPFSFNITVKGSEGISFAPVGRETTIVLFSAWPSPKFVGPFLPAERTITDDSGFEAEWRITSFGRSYPQTGTATEIDFDRVLASAAGVDLYEHVDLYTQVFRSIKYAVLFIAVTFLAFFLFETLTGVRIHPFQYLLIGTALALFYLLLLSLAEYIGFFTAYALATLMISSLITFYSLRVLAAKRRAFSIFALLVVLYAYLYFVLRQEDYALLFGSLLLFVFLAATMYLTRNINWFAARQHE